MKKLIILSTTAIALALAIPVFASSDDYERRDGDAKCITTGEWMTQDAAKAKAVELGYDVRRVKREDGCYELYAIDKKGTRVELYMNPVTGAIVKTKVKS